jgi:rhodanese-related sulfurtransferase
MYSHNYFLKTTALILLSIIFLTSCSQQAAVDEGAAPSAQKSAILLDWLEANGNYIHGNAVPALIDATDVYAMSNQNILVVDLRLPEQYDEGHIEHSINMRPPQVLDYFKNSIEPKSFEKIVFVTSNGFVAGYVAAITRMLGFDNTYALRFGLSSWDKSIAEKFWLANINSDFVDKLDYAPHPKNNPGNLPALAVEANNGLEIAWERANQLLENFTPEYLVSAEEVFDNHKNYYIANYWPEDKYLKNGHIPGAIQYQPKVSFQKSTDLTTLPTDKTIVVYCYSGQHSNFMVAYLHLLGYDVRSVAYGANGFIHQIMAETEASPSRTFTKEQIKNLPLVKSGETPSLEKMIEIPTETIKVAGGC